MSDISPITPTGVPTSTFPWRLKPYNNITPVTYRDGETLIEMYRNLRHWLFRELVPYIDDTITDYVVAFNEALGQVEAAFTDIKEYVATQKADFDANYEAKLAAFNDAVNNANGTLQAAVTAAANSAQASAASATAAQNAKTAAELAASTVPNIQDANVAGYVGNAQSALVAALKVFTDNRVGRISIKAYGAVGDGVADDTAAIQSTLTQAANVGGSVWVPKGRFLCNGAILPANTIIDGVGTLVQVADDVPILRTASDNSEAITANVASTVSMGDNVINTNTYQNNLSAGDYILLYDGTSYDPTAPTNVSGEIMQVNAVSVNTITTRNKVKGSFAADRAYTLARGASLRKVTLTENITVRGLILEGRLTSGITLIQAYYTKNFIVDGIHVTRGGREGVRFQIGTGSRLVNSLIENLVDDLANNHMGYGVQVVSASDDTIIANNHFRNTRHGFSNTGGTKGIPRNVTVTGNTVENRFAAEGGSGGAGIDTHSGVDGITIVGNTIVNSAIGVTVRGRNVSVKNNTISRCVTGVRVAETVASDVDISDNMITDATRGVHVSDPCNNVAIRGNKISRVSDLPIYIQGQVTKLDILENVIRDAQANGMSLVSTCENVLIAANRLIDCGIAGAANAIAIGGDGTGNGRLDIINNTMMQSSPNSMQRAVNAARATVVKGNTILGSSRFNAVDKWYAIVGGNAGANQTGNNEY